MPHRHLVAVAAVLGFLNVALGAFGAHGLGLEGKSLDTWHTAGQYGLGHSLATLLAVLLDAPRAGWLFAAGTAVFSGSLYLLVLTDTRWLGAVTPLGGVCLLAGWGVLAYQALGARG